MRPVVPFTSVKTIPYVLLAACAFATACGEMARVPTSPTSATFGPGQTQAQGGQQLPFNGSLQARELDVVAPPYLLVNGTATGTGTHLGQFTATFTATVTLATGAATGNIVLTAANGDRLEATLVGQGTPTEPNVASIVERATIHRGTGRFSGASGSFTIRRVLDQVTGESAGSFDGTINLEH